MVKRIISCFMVIIIISGIFLFDTKVWASDPASDLYYEDFEGIDIGNTPSDWNMVNREGLTVGVAENDGPS